MTGTRLFLRCVGVIALGLLGCSHLASRASICQELPMDSKSWQVDRVEPPWLIFLNGSGETVEVPRGCMPQASEGMVFRNRRRDHSAERRLRGRITAAFGRLTGRDSTLTQGIEGAAP